MNRIRVAAAVVNQTPMAWESNLRNIREAIDQARDGGATILCLPEMCITGYGCEDMFASRGVHENALRSLDELLPATRGMAVSVGLPLFFRNAVFNAACLIVDGSIAGFAVKQHLAGEGLHYEPRWFKPWPAGLRSTIDVDGRQYPIGDLIFDVGGVRIGFEICEDAWVATRPGGGLALAGVDVILNPSASHFAFGKMAIRERLVVEGSRAFGVTYIYSNLLGNEAGRAIYDGGAMIASGGRLLAVGPRFSYADAIATSATVDIDATRMSQARTASFEPNLDDDARSLRIQFDWKEPSAANPSEPASRVFSDSKYEEFTRAVSLALFDYLRKSRSNGFVISLSGGADSAACACLVATMIRLARAELSPARFAEKLNLPARLGNDRIADAEIVAALLTCAYQSTANSGDTTRRAARTIAQALGATFVEFDVERLVREYIRFGERAIGRPLDWKHDDIALQNIQARVRAPGVWLLANVKNALLLSTSNRSEAAVGYATMDGDTCGGLCPIAGIDKNFLRMWLKWMETTGPHGLGTIPALVAINVQAPTAELRPPGSRQTDEDDLMPYDVLDAIERAAIRDKLAPIEVFETLRPAFPRHAPQQLALWIERFFKLWSRNQWKRERYAPSFHLDDENLDPKTWCRFPILSGGFERELKELAALHLGDSA
jgi:NAD+ synthase (glutamine-hydrolysing)